VERKKARQKSFTGLWISSEKIVSAGRIHGNLLAVAPHPFKLDYSLDQGEQGVIPAAADIVAGMDLGAVLTIDNVAGFYRLTTEFFTAKSLTI